MITAVSLSLPLDSAGLAVGLGIGAIAEVAKQSFGSRRSGGEALNPV